MRCAVNKRAPGRLFAAGTQGIDLAPSQETEILRIFFAEPGSGAQHESCEYIANGSYDRERTALHFGLPFSMYKHVILTCICCLPGRCTIKPLCRIEITFRMFRPHEQTWSS